MIGVKIVAISFASPVQYPRAHFLSVFEPLFRRFMKYTLGLRKKRSRREEASLRQREDQGEKRPVISMASQRDRLTDSRKLSREHRCSFSIRN
jgi:hypothetical protein